MARPTKYVSRGDLGWGTTPANYANLRSGLVVHYDSGNQNLANKPHSACITYWRNTRAFHTGPSRGWVDVGYSFMACSHGYVLEGRGLNRVQAAQPGGNATHYSVTLATGPRDEITEQQINAVRELRLWLIQDHNNSGSVYGHRDFIATSCPGDKAYALVKDGTFTKAPGSVGGGTDMENPLIGLREGDGKDDGLKENVIGLQRLVSVAGFDLGTVDGHWGPKTTAAIKALRQSLGSEATSFTSITGTAYSHIIRAIARKEAQDVLRAGGGGTGGGTLPTTENVTLTGILRRA